MYSDFSVVLASSMKILMTQECDQFHYYIGLVFGSLLLRKVKYDFNVPTGVLGIF